MKRAVIILFLLAAGALRLPAQGVAANETLTFCLVQADPVSAGMGFAGRASVKGAAWSAFRNPGAAVLQDGRGDIALSALFWGPESAYARSYAAGGAVRLGRFGLSGALAEHRCALDPDLGFAPRDRSVGVGAAISVAPSVSAGFSVQNLRSELLPDYTLNASSVHMLLTGEWGGFRVTGGVADIGTLIQGNRRSPLPTALVLAGEWSASFGPGGFHSGRGSSDGTGRGPHSLRIDTDLDWFFRSGSFTAALGAEYGFRDLVFFRAGYHYAHGSSSALPSFATLGAGIRLHGVRFDLAWLTGNDIIGNTLSLGIGVSL